MSDQSIIPPTKPDPTTPPNLKKTAISVAVLSTVMFAIFFAAGLGWNAGVALARLVGL